MRTKEKQLVAKNVEDILQRADAAEYLELAEEEEAIFESIRDINASIQSAHKRGKTDIVVLLEKDLAGQNRT